MSARSAKGLPVRARQTAPHQRHDARAADSGMDFVTAREPQGLGDPAGGAQFLEAQLGMGVQIAAKGGQFRLP